MSVHAIIASYNTHGGVGVDRRFAPQRIADVVGELHADIVALQELRAHKGGVDMLELLRQHSGLHAVSGTTMTFADGAFGNGLLTRFAPLTVEHITLDVGGREPRGAIDVTLDVNGRPLRVVATHLGLSVRERHVQVGRLLTVLRRRPEVTTVLLGDINEWFVHRAPLRWLHAHFGESPARATFPSLLPLLALDRIWCAPGAALRNVRAHRSRSARVASDHLPLLAELEFAADRY